jgi:hypothetical protein
MALVSKVVESTVDSLVTPSGLSRLLTGTRPRTDDEGQAQQVEEQRADPFKRARYSYDSDAKFSAWVRGRQGTGDEIRIVFTREGLSWKLSNIVVPQAVLEGGKNASAKPDASNASPAS